MKFIECYIENFGKLKEFRQEFKDGLNVILEENGFGKTTFAAFIQAMFYGLDAGRTKDSDRKKYDPWQGGKFGGSIIFSLNGRTYRLERFFGKREKDDTFALYNEETGLESKDFTENIGCEIFGLDKESYSKCAYIPQGKVESELSGAGNINAKLSDLSEVDNDMASFDKAMKDLKDFKNKYKRSSGLVAEKELAKSNAEAELKRSESLLETELMIKEELHSKRRLKKELEEKIEKLHKSNAEKEKAEHYKTIKNDAEDSEGRVKGYEAEMKKIPTFEELSLLYNLTEEYKKSETIKRTAELSEAEKEVLEKADAYETHELTEAEYKSITEKIQVYKTKKAVTESANLTEEEQVRLLNLRKMFSENNFDMSKLEEIYYKAREAKEKLGFLKVKKFPAIPVIMGAVLLLLGIIFMCFFSVIVGAALALTSIVLSVIFIIKNKTENSGILREIDNANKAISKADEVFSTYDDDYAGKYEEALRSIRLCDTELNNLELKEKRAAEFTSDSKLDELKKELDEILGHYLKTPFSEYETEEVLSELYKHCSELKLLEEKKKRYEEASKTAENRYAELKENAFIFTDASPEKAYEELKILCEKLNAEKENYTAKNNLLKEFIAANGIPEENHEFTGVAELEAAKSVLSETGDIIKDLEKRLSGIIAETEKIPELTAGISELEDEISNLKKKVSLIEKTEVALQTAKENLTLKYLGPLAERFEKYKTTLMAPEKTTLDAELNIGAIEYGERHQASSYSTGLRDILSIALRFSLIDALFGSEKPVVVLDDPFTNLDENRIESAKKAIETLSEEYQILYLTCHESRT